MVLIRGAFDEYPLLHENMLWYSLEVLLMNTHFPQHICFHGVKKNKYQYFWVEKGILAGAMHRVMNMIINRSVAIAAQFYGTFEGLWNYQILLLVHTQVNSQNSFVQLRFTCLKVHIFLISWKKKMLLVLFRSASTNIHNICFLKETRKIYIS